MGAKRTILLASLVILINAAVLTTEDACAGGCGSGNFWCSIATECDDISQTLRHTFCEGVCADNEPKCVAKRPHQCDDTPGLECPAGWESRVDCRCEHGKLF